MKFYNMNWWQRRQFKRKHFWKFLNEEECHNDLQYHDGIVEDILPFNPAGDCEEGGIYFASKDILEFLDYGPWVREVTFPEDAQIYRNPDTIQKWKADKVILGPRRRFSLELLQELESNGADIHINDDFMLFYAASRGHLDMVKYLVKHGADLNVDDDDILRMAAECGHLNVVIWLVERGLDIHAGDEAAFRGAARNGHLDVVKYLVEHGADIHVWEDFVIRVAIRYDRFDVVKYLKKISEKDKL